MRFFAIIYFVTLIFFLSKVSGSVPAQPPSYNVTEAAQYARKLVNASKWGVVSNNDYRTNMPFGNVVSYADGGSGTPYFYLTYLDEATANFSRVDSRTSLSIGQIGLGNQTCGDYDPQEPPCGKLTLSGWLNLVTNSKEKKFARAALFRLHHRFAYVPKNASFTIFKLDISNIYVVNNYTHPVKRPPVHAYYEAKLF